MKTQLLLQHENRLISRSFAVENINLWGLLKQRNAKLISYWKKLVDNSFIVFKLSKD